MNISLIRKVTLFAAVLTSALVLTACSKTADNSTASGDPRAAQVATALTQAGVKFYGASWCPHCAAQKALFGDFVKDLPYIECSTPDKKDQTDVCKAAGIMKYPTWEFQDKTRYEGELTIDQLIDKAHLTIASADQPGPVAPATQ